MGYYIIQGKFYVRGYSPDGDSIRFEANQNSHWNKIGLTVTGKQQLRLEGIDTLETHFKVGTKNTHQPRALAEQALEYLLARVGITNIHWSNGRVDQANEGTAGYIISAKPDGHDRPIAFVYRGTPNVPDGTAVILTRQRVQKSINAELLGDGLAYPTYYQGGISQTVRHALTEKASAARTEGVGVWAEDTTRRTAGTSIADLDALQDDVVLLPKLFRRLATHLATGGSLASLDLSGDKLRLEGSPQQRHLGEFVRVVGNTVFLDKDPEQMIFRG